MVLLELLDRQLVHLLELLNLPLQNLLLHMEASSNSLNFEVLTNHAAAPQSYADGGNW